MIKDPTIGVYENRGHEVWVCTKCGHKVHGEDIAMNLAMKWPSRFHEQRCVKCGHADEPFKKRNYGIPEKELLNRMDYTALETLRLSKKPCQYPETKLNRKVRCGTCETCWALKEIHGS